MSSKTAARDEQRRRKVEALRAQQEAARRRRFAAFGAVGLVVVVVVGLVVAKAATGGKTVAPAAKSTVASAGTIAQLTSVPQSALDAVGKGTVTASPQAISGAALTSDGKPEVVYLGAEYCPYCAAERWAVVQALSRFGTFTGLGETTSASDDVYPSTPTLSFHGATYTSDYLSFRGFEEQSNQKGSDGQYTKLDTVPSDVITLATTYDKAGSIPFVDLGGKSTIVGAGYDPQVLSGKTQAEVATALHDPTSAIAKAVLGTANTITAKLCDLTGNKPANVCSTSAVTAARSAG